MSSKEFDKTPMARKRTLSLQDEEIGQLAPTSKVSANAIAYPQIEDHSPTLINQSTEDTSFVIEMKKATSSIGKPTFEEKRQ